MTKFGISRMLGYLHKVSERIENKFFLISNLQNRPDAQSCFRSLDKMFNTIYIEYFDPFIPRGYNLEGIFLFVFVNFYVKWGPSGILKFMLKIFSY